MIVRHYMLVMAKIPTTRRSTKATMRTAASGRGRGTLSKVKFGDVVVTTPKPERSVVAANVVRSSEALERVAKKLLKPGFSSRQRQDVPRFSIDEADTKVFIRQLNGRTDRGRFVNGRFEVVD